MTLLIGFLAPIAIYMAIWLLHDRPRLKVLPQLLTGNLPLFATVLVVVWSTAALSFTLWTAPSTFSATQITWRGLISKNQNLELGGPRESSVIGWPNESQSPRISIKRDGNDIIVQSSDSTAFLYQSKEDKYVNGVLLTADSPFQAETAGQNYLFKETTEWLIWKYAEISVNGTTIAKFPIRPGRSDQVQSIASLISTFAETLTEKDSRFQLIEDAKRWAADARMLSRPTGEVRILTREMTSTSKCSPPNCSYRVTWQNSYIPFSLDPSKDGKIRCDFLPPWRASSPLPLPPEAKNQLVITGQLLPGDFAFQLPLGDSEPLRDQVEIKQHDNGSYFLVKPNAQNKTVQTAMPFGITVQSTNDESIVGGKNVDFIFGITQDSFLRSKLAYLVLMGAALFILALILSSWRTGGSNNWIVFGLAGFVWVALTIRLTLALRFSLELEYLDKNAVQGLSLAIMALVFLPNWLLILHIAIADRADRLSRTSWSLLLMIVVSAASVYSFLATGDLWPTMPASYRPSLGIAAYLLTVVFGIFIAMGLIKYLWPGIPAGIADVLLDLPARIHGYFRNLTDIVSDKGLVYGVFCSSVVIAVAAVLFVLIWLLTRTWGMLPGGSGSKLISQVLVPIPIYLITLLYWISLKDAYRTISWPRHFFGAIGILSILFVSIPFGLSDLGNLFPSIALVFASALLLFISGVVTKNRNFRGAGSALFVWLLVGFLVFEGLNTGLIPVSWVPSKTAQARILAYQKGDDIQHYLLTADIGSNGEGLNYQDLVFSAQHHWENRALPHEAGLFGFGFGKAPVRRSQIRLDTMQFDSLFSFYLLGDFGVVGGISVLLLFLLPLGMLLLSGRERFHAGHGLAFVLLMLLCLEGVIHAAMDTGLIPMTGRSLPLLAVGSFSGDFLRWGILISLALFAILWGVDRKGSPKDVERPDILETNSTPTQWRMGGWSLPMIFQSAILIGVPLACVVLVASSAVKILVDKDLEGPLTLERVKHDVTALIENGVVRVAGTESDPALELDESRVDTAAVGKKIDSKLIRQQIAKFNAMPLEQRTGNPITRFSAAELNKIKSQSDYTAFLQRIRTRTSSRPGLASRNLFQLVPLKQMNEDEQAVAGLPAYSVVFNPDFDIKFSFKEPVDRPEIPVVSFGGDNQQIIGAAWNRGHWITAYRSDSDSLSWADYLASSLKNEWKALGPGEAIRRYGKLTIDKDLQTSASRFMDDKGRALHAATLQKYGNTSRLDDKLPPRVGLTIISLGEPGPSNAAVASRNGEILALGGFPRTVAGSKWGENADMPPSSVVENLFPVELQRRLLGDRNFDNSVVMGSSTKPIWAAAVLDVHPKLDSQLKVQGANSRENTVFGIKIVPDDQQGKFWSVTPSPWVDFRTYLAKSDNRYQVRLGFLGLAEKDHGDVDLGKNSTNSINESLSGMTPRPIGRVPKFLDAVGFSAERPGTMENLDRSSLAARLRSLYGAGTSSSPGVGDYKRHLFSIWTKNEDDDILKDSSSGQASHDASSSFLYLITPARVDLSLDLIRSPRDYISLLLGGNNNRWSNVQMAAAFASAVTGIPVMPHIVKNADVPVFKERDANFTEASRKLAAGLTDVVFNGTATKSLTETQALAFLSQLKQAGYEIFAKTGTLRSAAADAGPMDREPTSRFVLAIVKFTDRSQGKIQSGLVFSIFGERAGQHAADTWLGQFITGNQDAILKALGESTAPPGSAPKVAVPARQPKRARR